MYLSMHLNNVWQESLSGSARTPHFHMCEYFFHNWMRVKGCAWRRGKLLRIYILTHVNVTQQSFWILWRLRIAHVPSLGLFFRDGSGISERILKNSHILDMYVPRLPWCLPLIKLVVIRSSDHNFLLRLILWKWGNHSSCVRDLSDRGILKCPKCPTLAQFQDSKVHTLS